MPTDFAVMEDGAGLFIKDRTVSADEDEALPIYITRDPIRRYEIARAIVAYLRAAEGEGRADG